MDCDDSIIHILFLYAPADKKTIACPAIPKGSKN